MNTSEIYSDITDTILRALRRPGIAYYLFMLLAIAGITWGVIAWILQERMGFGITGLNHPVMWAVYIGNYVFWIAVAMAGSFVSAVLFLVRARFRSSVSRTAETMTFFAVIIAGLFPLIHLGRLWVFYYIIPYPSERQIWPNFQSPLVWDFISIGSYLTASWLFYYVGLLPDLRSAADHGARLGVLEPFRTGLNRKLALGFSFAASQWRHYDLTYLLFAALVTPLAVSIHTITSWIFGMGLLPGWHETIFAPYFVAGAVFSGSAIALAILIPMRKLFHFESLITERHISAMTKLIVASSLILTYVYCVEPFMSSYSHDIFERQFSAFKTRGWIAIWYWMLWATNAIIPLLLLLRSVRKHLGWVVVICILITCGMWIERFVLVAASTSHDFLPHNWGLYAPHWPEFAITTGVFLFLFFGIFLFAKLFPMVAIADVKQEHSRGHDAGTNIPGGRLEEIPAKGNLLKALFSNEQSLVSAAVQLKRAGFRKMELYSPFQLKGIGAVLGRGHSPVRYWTLAGFIIGGGLFLWLEIWSSHVNNLVVGGKPPAVIWGLLPPFFDVALVSGAIFNFAAMIIHAKLYSTHEPRGYDPRFSRDTFGLVVACNEEKLPEARVLLKQYAEEIYAGS